MITYQQASDLASSQLAKMLRYLSFTKLCDATFVCFMTSWLVTRHFLFLLVIISTYSDAPRLCPLVWNPSQGHFVTLEVLNGFNAMLISLQVSICMLTILRDANCQVDYSTYLVLDDMPRSLQSRHRPRC